MISKQAGGVPVYEPVPRPLFCLSDLFLSFAFAVRLTGTAHSPPAGLANLEFPGLRQHIHQCHELLFCDSVIVDTQPSKINLRLFLLRTALVAHGGL